MTNIETNDTNTNNGLNNDEKEKTQSHIMNCSITPTTMLSPHSIDHSILNHEALHELEDAALFLLDDDDDHQILTFTPEETKHETAIEPNILMNAVHMEVQENAKVSTLPVSINRTKSNSNNFVNKPYYVREMLKERSLSVDDSTLNDKAPTDNNANTFVEGFKLAEIFLHCNERESAALAYSNVMRNKLQIKAETNVTSSLQNDKDIPSSKSSDSNASATCTNNKSKSTLPKGVSTNTSSSDTNKSALNNANTTQSSLTRNLYLNNNKTNDKDQNKNAEKDSKQSAIVSHDAIATAAALASVQNLFHVINKEENPDVKKNETENGAATAPVQGTNTTENNVDDNEKIVNSAVESNAKDTAEQNGNEVNVINNQEVKSACKNVKREEDQETSKVMQPANPSTPPLNIQQQQIQSNNQSQHSVISTPNNIASQPAQPSVNQKSVAPIPNAIAQPSSNHTMNQQQSIAAPIPNTVNTATQIVQPSSTHIVQQLVIAAPIPSNVNTVPPVQQPSPPAVASLPAAAPMPLTTNAPIPPPSILPPYTTPSPAVQPTAPQFFYPAPTAYPTAAAPTPPSLFPPAPQYPFSTLMPTSILEASRRQNQFGFGNHVVPSVPPPPMKYRPNAQPPVPPPVPYVPPPTGHHPYHMPLMPPPAVPAPPSTPAPTTVHTTKTKTKSVANTNLTTSTATSSNNINSTAIAYERKKQRAKDGRVKFNDAVEKLSIAISLAGDQSKHRSTQPFNKLTLDTMMECSAIASTAKKYDRPSFVATAAMLIQSMNSQCDALVQELQAAKKEKEVLLQQLMQQSSNAQIMSTPPVNTNASLKRKVRDEYTNVTQHDTTDVSVTPATADHQNQTTGTPPKRNKISQQNALENLDHFSSITNYGPVLQTIASYLDPLSLTRCNSVCKYWNNIRQFTNDTTWKSLCIKRFGNVQLERHQSQNTKMIHIYKNMSLQNIKPYTTIINDDNVVKLGEVQNNKIGVNAVVYMTQRSNGETLRSVLTSPKQIPISTSVSPSSINYRPEYTTLPIIELRILIQNYHCNNIIIPTNQSFIVDKSTRRCQHEMHEVTSKYDDFRFEKCIYNLDGTISKDDVELRLFDSVVFSVYIYAHKCPTSLRFIQRAKFLKFVSVVNSITMPIVVPFDKIDEEQLKLSSVALDELGDDVGSNTSGMKVV